MATLMLIVFLCLIVLVEGLLIDLAILEDVRWVIIVLVIVFAVIDICLIILFL
jgi:NhaP-type Na+/H+ or K+/H+ antiporter